MDEYLFKTDSMYVYFRYDECCLNYIVYDRGFNVIDAGLIDDCSSDLWILAEDLTDECVVKSCVVSEYEDCLRGAV